MTSLESIVLPLEQSRSLVEQNIDLDTACIWVMPMKLLGDARPLPYVTETERKQEVNHHFEFVPAPVLSELLDAIRAAVGDMDAECSFGIYKVDGTLQHGVAVDWVDVKDWEADRHKGAYSSTDLLAAAALLMEVSR